MSTIYTVIENRIGADGALPKDFHLPRKEQENEKVIFADGAMDGISIYHTMQGPLSEDEVKELGALLQLASEEKKEEAERGFAAFCQKKRVVSIIDELQQYIYDHTSQLNENNLYHFAVDLLIHSEEAECVKIGMSILELFDTDDKPALKNVIRNLGLSDEFTIFTVFLMRGWTNGNMEILELAKKVHGWGRIHCVSFIEPENEEIKAWILENGVDNEVMAAYSAMPAFDKADVMGLLDKRNLSKKEFKGMIKIVRALLDEGPVRGISNLVDPIHFLKQFLQKAEEMEPLEEEDSDVLREVVQWLEEVQK